MAKTSDKEVTKKSKKGTSKTSDALGVKSNGVTKASAKTAKKSSKSKADSNGTSDKKRKSASDEAVGKEPSSKKKKAKGSRRGLRGKKRNL